MLRKKLGWTLLMIGMLVSGSLFTWYYLQIDYPKKSPVRAKQVYLYYSADHYYS